MLVDGAFAEFLFLLDNGVGKNTLFTAKTRLMQATTSSPCSRTRCRKGYLPDL